MNIPFLHTRGYSFRSTLAYVAMLAILPVVLPSVPLAIEIAITTLAALSCHLLLAYGPLLSFGQGAFFGLGAYTGGLYALRTAGMPAGDALIALLLSGLLGSIAAFLVGAIALRRIAGIGGKDAGGVTFLMLTFAVSQIAYFAAYSLPQWTGGDNGLLDIPRLHAAAIWSLSSPISFYGFCALLLAVVVLTIDVVLNSVTGQAFRAVIENEDRASAVGYSVFSLRLALFTVSGGIAAVAGCLYAFFLGLVPLSAIDIGQSERIVVATVLGGIGSPIGALLGTICFVVGADLLARSWPHWPFALGAAIVFIVFFARAGIWGAVEAAIAAISGGRFRHAAAP